MSKKRKLLIVLAVAFTLVVAAGAMYLVYAYLLLTYAAHMLNPQSTVKPGTPAVDQYGIPTSHVTYEWVHARPEGTLYIPGSKVFHKFGHSMDGYSTATSGAILTLDAPPDTIYQWYDAWLKGHDWECNAATRGGLDTWITSKQCKKKGSAREIFVVAMDNPDSLSGTVGEAVPKDVTVFEIRYMVGAPE